jgi:hypothetical protein
LVSSSVVIVVVTIVVLIVISVVVTVARAASRQLRRRGQGPAFRRRHAAVQPRLRDARLGERGGGKSRKQGSAKQGSSHYGLLRFCGLQA